MRQWLMHGEADAVACRLKNATERSPALLPVL